MSNSKLVDYIKISPNKTSPRKDKIRKITIHHMAGDLTVETCGEVFAPSSRQTSSNYGIGTDGRVGMYVEEKDRAWTSSSPNNDNQAITIEVANDQIGGDWHVSDKALAKLIELCVDICQRNGIEKLNYTGDKTGNLTMHKWFTTTNCPGSYLESKFPYIAEQVNKQLGVQTTETILNVGDEVYFSGNTHYTSADAESGKPCKSGLATITNKHNGKHKFHIIGTGACAAYGWVDEQYLHKKMGITTANLNLRKGNNTNTESIGVMLEATRVFILGTESNGWYKVYSVFLGEVGFCSNSWILIKSP